MVYVRIVPERLAAMVALLLEACVLLTVGCEGNLDIFKLAICLIFEADFDVKFGSVQISDDLTDDLWKTWPALGCEFRKNNALLDLTLML